MSEFKFACPFCGQHFQCDEQMSGHEIQCVNCHLLLHIPPVPGKTTQYRPESGKTWATFISDGRIPPPKRLALCRDEPLRNRPEAS